MSEPKRVSFSTLGSSAPIAAFGVGVGSGVASALGGTGGGNISSTSVTALRFGTDFLAGQANVDRGSTPGSTANKNGNKTLRLNMELFPTDSCSYPEFNYSKMLHLEKKKMKKLKQKSNGFAVPFNDNDDDVARIAKELEKKYGSTYGSGRGRSRKDDHCDIGLGYDESDSFIDNTEAYDEIIPEEVETIEGGFYINCGALEFKKLHTESTKSRTDEIIKMPNRARKRVLSSSSSSGESSSTEDEDDDEVDSEGEASSIETTITKGKNNNGATPSGEKRQKSSTGNSSTSAPTVLKKSQPQTQDQENSNSNSSNKKKKSMGVCGSSSSNSPKPPSSVGSDSDKERVRQKTVKTTTVKDMLKAKRDNFLKMQEGGGASVNSVAGGGSSGDAKTINGELKGAVSKSSEDESTSSDESGEASDSDHSVPPEKKLKKTGNADETKEKLRSVDTKLPDLDEEIIASLHSFKEMVKAKNMVGKRFQFDDTMTEVFLKIDEALLCIEKAQRNMVFAHLEYHLLLPKYYFLRKAKDLRVREEKQKSKRALGKLRKAVIEAMPGAIANFEVELRKHAELQAANVNSDHPPKMPKKKFPWNNNLRNLLYEVYQVRWTSYPVLGTRKETLEDFISVYMREKVVDLWPSGWMRYEELQREIEKRKSAARKAKDKKKNKEKDAVSNCSNAPTTSDVHVASAASTAQSTVSSMTMTAASSFLKQFEDFATGSRSSCANSDTESVASSGASNGLKRKNSDAIKDAGMRGKAQKNNNSTISGSGEQRDRNITTTACTNANINNESGIGKRQQQSPPIAVELSSLCKKPEHSIQNIMTAVASSNSPQLPAQAYSSTSPQSQSKHSKPSEPSIRVIDLDKYRSPSDILQTSQQMLKLESGTLPTITDVNTAYRRDSSSESDGVEIVGVYPAKSLPPPSVGTGKQKHKKNVSNAILLPTFDLKAAVMAGTNNNNNTNSNDNNNSKKAQSGNSSKAKEHTTSNVNEIDELRSFGRRLVVKDLQQLQKEADLLLKNYAHVDPKRDAQ